MENPARDDKNALLKQIAWLGILVAVVIAVGSYNGKRHQKERDEALQKKQRVSSVIVGLAVQYNADTSWWGKEIFFTAQAQDALMSKDGRPVLVIGILGDVSKDENDRYRLSFTSAIKGHGDLDFILEADSVSCRAATAKLSFDSTFGFYALVANISSVRQETSGESSRFIADGSCLHLTKIEDLPD